MIRHLSFGLILLFLPSCAEQSIKPVQYETVQLLPDAALVQPCDTTNMPVTTNGELAAAAMMARAQRDDCAARIDQLADWREKAAKAALPVLPKDQK